MVTTDLLRAFILGGLAIAVLTEVVSIPLLLITILCVGAAQCFFDSAAQAFIPVLVGRNKDALAHVNGRFWALDTVGRTLLGPPVGSLTFALSRAAPFTADAVSFLASAALVFRLPRTPAPEGPHEKIRVAIGNGLQHLFQTPELRILAFSAGVYNFAFNASMAIFVLYARHILAVPVAAYGALIAVGGIGGIAAGWQARLLTRSLSYRQTMAIAHLVQAVAWAGIAITGNVWVAGALFALAGAGSTLSSVAVGSARQALTPDALLGRVVSAFRIFGLGGAGLGAVVGGVVADAYGLSAALILSACVLVLGATLTWPYRH
jgi:predicted MFS family arabinose efflux permease